MCFKADFSQPRNNNVIKYIPSEYSFYCNASGVDSAMLIDCLELNIDSESGIVYAISGFHSYMIWKKAVLIAPISRNGVLKSFEAIESGETLRIAENVSTFVDSSSGWICIGSPEYISCPCVRFCENGIAVLNNGQLRALWVNPVFPEGFGFKDIEHDL